MRKFTHIWILTAIILISVFGCSRDDQFDDVIKDDTATSGTIVEVLADGRIQVSASISATTQTPIETRVTDAVSPDNVVYTGWCLVFGVDETLFEVSGEGEGQIVKYKENVYDSDGITLLHAKGEETDDGYGTNSPLLQKTKIIANTNGRFNMTFNTTLDRVFMRIVANISTREEKNYEGAITEADIPTDNTTIKAATFGQFIEQSVGLDGIYNFTYGGKVSVDYNDETGEGSGEVTYIEKNENSPDPSEQQRAFPMSSYGYVLKDGITSESMLALFKEEIKMIRIFSKIVVAADPGSGFIIDSVTLLKGANESRIRSTVLSSTSGDVGNLYTVPTDLGGAVPYKPIGVASSLTESMPIYLYPNKGGDYGDESISPTYVVIKGRAAGYSNSGYYKVALKAQYPETYDPDGTVATLSKLTYDILRDTYFRINLETVDKPGYATFGDAASNKNPPNNISYNIVINGEDNRHEFLVSKGTYFVELKTSRFYVKGYLGEAISGSVDFALVPAEGAYCPNIYIYSDDEDVTITGLSDSSGSSDVVITQSKDTSLFGYPYYKLEGGEDEISPTITFTAKGTGRICIRCGDILKYIPVVYDDAMVSYLGGELIFTPDDGSSVVTGSFAYNSPSDLIVDEGYNRILESNGRILTNELNYDSGREMQARIYPSDGGGVASIYLKQASDLKLEVGGDDLVEGDEDNPTVHHEYTGFGNRFGRDGEDIVKVGEADNAVTYDFRGLDVEVTCQIDDHYKSSWSQSEDGKLVVVDAPNIPYIVSALPGSFGDYIGNNKIILTNPAGDVKEYLIKQTQHQPIYFLSSELGDLYFDTYAIISAQIKNVGEYIRTVNVYNTQMSFEAVSKDIYFDNERQSSSIADPISDHLTIGIHNPNQESDVLYHSEADPDADLWCQVYRTEHRAGFSGRWWEANIIIKLSDLWGEEYSVSIYTYGYDM